MSQGQGTGTDPELPEDINTNVAHPARVYDYWLGGKDNFPADRALAELMIEAIPNMRAMAAANRAFLSRAVRSWPRRPGSRWSHGAGPRWRSSSPASTRSTRA